MNSHRFFSGKSVATVLLVACAVAIYACQPASLVSGSVCAPTSLVADSKKVYFTNNVVLVDAGATGAQPFATVADVPILGGAQAQLALHPSAPHNYDSITTDGQNVYWQVIDNDENGSVDYASLDGGASGVLLGPVTSAFKAYGVQSLAANSTGLYWANTGGSQIVSVPKNGVGYGIDLLPDTTPQGIFYYPYSIAVDDVNAYFTTDRGDVYEFPLNGTPPIVPTLLVAAPGPDAIAQTNVATDGAFVYWTNFGAGTVNRVPVGGGAPTVIASGQTDVRGIATDGTNVYWTLFSSSGSVLKAPVASVGATPTVIASGQAFPLSIALSPVSVVWGNVTAPNAWGFGFTGAAATNGIVEALK